VINMQIEQMYKGIAYSPNATIVNTIGPTDTVIEVTDIDAFPDAPNIAVIGTDENAETILYATKVNNNLSGCTRGLEGMAKEWQKDEIISRNFTNYDYERLIQNILKLYDEKVSKEEGMQLSSNNFTDSAKTKLEEIEEKANKYIHPEKHLATIIIQDENNCFVSEAEKNSWNAKQSKLEFTPEYVKNRGASNGYAPLDENGKVPISNIPTIEIPVMSVNGKTGEIELKSQDIKQTILSCIVNTQDENGKPTKLTYKREDNTIAKVVEASNPNENNLYQTIIEKDYNSEGTALLETRTYSLTYNNQGYVIERMVVAS
jgi:hypothetical protein